MSGRGRGPEGTGPNSGREDRKDRKSDQNGRKSGRTGQASDKGGQKRGGTLVGKPQEGTTSLTRKQRLIVGGVTLVLVAAAVTMIVFSLQRPEVEEYLPTSANPSPVGDSLVGPATYTVDASVSGEWVFFDFSRGSVVPDPGPLEWDLAFQRFYFVANGGGGFDGRGGLLDLGPVAFDSVAIVPTEGYVLSEADTDTTNAATAEWYDYSFTSHLLTPRPRTYAVRTADGRYAKLEVVGYYCPGARPGCLTFRFAYQGDGSPRVGPRVAPGSSGRSSSEGAGGRSYRVGPS